MASSAGEGAHVHGEHMHGEQCGGGWKGHLEGVVDLESREQLCRRRQSRRRELCHFADALSLSIPIATPTNGRGGCSRMTVSPPARRRRPLSSGRLRCVCIAR